MFSIQSIDPGMTFTSEISAHHLNQSKNRYPNIVPCKYTNLRIEVSYVCVDACMLTKGLESN
jgi:protein tyrosine phosphatase